MGGKTILWTIIGLIVGIALGFGFRGQIASALNLDAIGFAPSGSISVYTATAATCAKNHDHVIAGQTTNNCVHFRGGFGH